MEDRLLNEQAPKLTWKQFKQFVENAGIKDADEIDDIDISWGEIDEMECIKDEVFGWKIRL